MALDDRRWCIVPSSVRGGGWRRELVAVDGFELASDDADVAALPNDRFDLR